MPHRSSAAALHTARKILREYELSIKPNGPVPNLDATPEKLSVVIDYATNVHKIASLRPELRYWQKRLKIGEATAEQIGNLMNKMLNELALVPQDAPTVIPITTTFKIPEFGNQVFIKPLSKAARETTRFIYFYYTVMPINGFVDITMDQHNMTRLAEACLGIVRVLPLIAILKTSLKQLKENKATELDIRKCLREAGVLLAYLPNYGSKDINEETKLLV